MKIVVVAPRFPFPLDKGDRLTVFHLLKYFSEQGHQVSLVCFLEPEQDSEWVNKVASFCQRVEIVRLHKSRAYVNSLLGILDRKPLQLHYYSDPAMHQAVQWVINDMQPDLLYAHTIRMGQYIEHYQAYSRVLAMQISMKLNYRRLLENAPNFLAKAFYATEYHKVSDFEDEFANQFDKVLLISKHDLNAIEQNNKKLDNVYFSPHGVDFNYFAPNTNINKSSNTLILTGNMNYAPNMDAAVYFCEEVLPLVRQKFPDVKLNIVGADPSSKILALKQDPSIQVTGRVPDLRDYMNQAQIAIAPLRIGAGLQNKVLEGMSMGLPMVITSVANEGIQAVDKKNVLIADSASAFAEQIIILLKDQAYRFQLGTAARDFIVQNWSWEKHFGELEQMFIQLISEKTEYQLKPIKR